jgi:hypothetical protein
MAKSKSGEDKPHKEPDGKNKRAERIREYLFDIGWFFVDLWFVWPTSHVWAVVFASYLIGIHLITSPSKFKRKMIYCAIWLGCTALLIWIVPPNETATYGFLSPASDASPRGPCNESGFPNADFVYFGGSEVVVGPNSETGLVVIAGHKLLSFILTPEGLSISGDIYNEAGELAHISDNEFTLNPNTTFRNERPDRHTLIICDNFGMEVFRIRYANHRAVTFTGRFFFPGRRPVLVTDEGVFYQNNPPEWSQMASSCYIRIRNLITVQ